MKSNFLTQNEIMSVNACRLAIAMTAEDSKVTEHAKRFFRENTSAIE